MTEETPTLEEICKRTKKLRDDTLHDVEGEIVDESINQQTTQRNRGEVRRN